MSRFIYQNHFKDRSGNTISDGSITVYEAGGTTLATVYSSTGASSPITGSVITSSTDGFFKFYADTKDYNSDQKFKINLSKSGFNPQAYDNITIFPEFEYKYYADAGATDQGVDNGDNSLADLIAEIGSSTKATIVLKSGTYTLSTNLTVSSNITLKIQSGAVITQGAAATLTINGPLEAGLYQIFSGFSAAQVTFDSGRIDYIYPQWWGAVGNGTTDDTTALQSAIDAAEAMYDGATGSSAGIVFLIPGIYLVSSALTITEGITLCGRNARDTRISKATHFANLLLVRKSNGTEHLHGFTLNNVTLQSTIASNNTDGALLKMQSCATARIENLNIEDGYVGIQLLSVIKSYFVNLNIEGGKNFTGQVAGSTMININGGGGHPTVDIPAELFFTNCNLVGHDSNYVQYGMTINAADGIFMDNCHILRFYGNGLGIFPDTRTIASIKVSNSFMDSGAANSYSVSITGTDALTYTDISFSGCTFYGDGTTHTGVHITTGSVISIVGSLFHKYAYHGIHATNTDGTIRNLVISGNIFRENNFGNVNAEAINIGAAVSYFSITNNILENGATQTRGIAVIAGASNSYIISGNINNNASVADLSDGGTGTAKYLNDNVVSDSITVASAASITLPYTGLYVIISGVVNITSVTASWTGRKVTLIFQDILTFTDGGNLVLAGNFVTTASDTITLICDGTNWIEVSRSVN